MTNFQRYLASAGWLAIIQAFANSEYNVLYADLVTKWITGQTLTDQQSAEAESIVDQAIQARGGGVTRAELEALAELQISELPPLARQLANDTGVSVANATAQLLVDEDLRAIVQSDYERAALDEPEAEVGVDAFSSGAADE